MITLNAIEQRLRQFAENHFFIHSYGFGSPDEVDLDKYTAFPLLYVVYTGATYDDNKAYSFEVYVLDRPTEQEAKSENRREVVSDSEQCLEDLVADITTGFNIFQWDEAYNVEAASVSPIVDARTNVLSGALLDLTISVPYQYESCNLPIDGVQPQGGEISYARRGLLRILTQDGTTDVPSVNTIKVTNGTLTDEGDGIVSIDTGGVDILGDLENVNLDDPQDHEALVYDQDTATWINGASTKIGIRVINLGLPLLRGCPVRATGVQGDQVIVAHFNASQHDPKTFIGLLSENVNNGATGYARQTGTIYNLNTSAFEIGDILYPKGGVFFSNSFDSMTTDVPTAPAAKIPCAIVLRKHANTGRVYVRTWTPSRKIEDMDDVQMNTVPEFRNGRTIVWDGQKWVDGYPRLDLNDLSDVEVSDPQLIPNKSLLRWDSTVDKWRIIPETGGNLPGIPDTITYFIGRYNDDASTSRQAADATLTIERYLSVQADGHGEEVSAQTDTPTSGNKIIRKIWHKAVSFEDSDVSTWTLVHTFADDTAYANTTATFNALLTAATYGSIPFSLAQTWEDVPAFTGLLDTYTGAAAAYSLRLLDSTYTGDAIRVRRASDNTEQDIGFADNELDTSALATFCAGTDGFVKTWYDQANANDATQTTTGNQPKIYDASTGVITQNGKPAVEFDGSNDEIPTGQDIRVFTIFAVATADDNAQNVIVGSVTDTNEFFRTEADAARIQNNTGVAVSAVTTNQNLIYALNDLTSEIGVNGGTAATGATQNDSFDALTIGQKAGAFYYYGRMQEIVIYDSDQSSNRTGIETNINDHYTIY